MTQIMDKLKSIESDKGIKILFAVEAGSRAWGFESPDSDYDIRFIYAHPLSWYLTPFPKRDVIEIMDGDFDYAGWDLRKALFLMKKSNPTFLEWLYSPIQYIADDDFLGSLRELADMYYSRKAAYHHYISMAKNNRRNYLEKGVLTVKKHLYVLRGIMCALWIEDRSTPPPVRFDLLYPNSDLWDLQVIADTEKLLELKQVSAESKESVNFPHLTQFINKMLDRGHDVDIPTAKKKLGNEPIDEFFQRIITAS